MLAGEILVAVLAACCERRDVDREGREGVAIGDGVLARDTEEAREAGGRGDVLGATEPARVADGVMADPSDTGAIFHPKRAAKIALWVGSGCARGALGDASPTVEASESLSSDEAGNATDEMTDMRDCTWRLLYNNS